MSSESIMKYLFWDCFILADQPILTPPWKPKPGSDHPTPTLEKFQTTPFFRSDGSHVA